MKTVRDSQTANIEPEVIEAKKPGPKRKYESWMCDKLKEVAREGGHIPAMMDAIGIYSKDTFYRWLKDYPEFKEAYEESKVISQAVYEALLFKGSVGLIKGFNVTGFAMIMNNKFSDDYKRSAVGNNTEININSVQLSGKELQQKITSTIKYLEEKGEDITKLLGTNISALEESPDKDLLDD